MSKISKLTLVMLLVLNIVFINRKTVYANNSGTFTATCMNVDGLPNKILGISISSDGPGSDGTKQISQKMATYGWDIIGVSEDFNYNTELLYSLTDYKSGTHRGGVSGLSNNTDGLNLLWKNNINVTGEKWTSWNTHYSTGIFGTGNGADGMIDKGYRYYQAEIAENVLVDVYILHMDADSDQGDINARESQLRQLVTAIKNTDNKNPIIIMGDTNCRYTRENLKSILIDGINADSRFTIQDAWIEKVRNGSYPEYGSDALVAKDKGGTYDYPDAEIVDKVFYINNSDSSVIIQANSYTISTDFTDENGNALADHWPVVVEFGYTLDKTEEHQHSYSLTERVDATCTEDGYETYTCSCEDSYTNTIPASGHKLETLPGENATCTETGLTEGQKCSVCGTIITQQENIPATGHHYVDGLCTACGVTDPDYNPSTPDQMTIGKEVNSIESGKDYVLVFSGNTGYFAMNLDASKKIVPYKLSSLEGEKIDNGLVWNITEYNKGYTISKNVYGKTQYLSRSKTFTGYGYKLSLINDPYLWLLNKNNPAHSFRFYDKTSYGTSYYLRYYNSTQGWIASTKAAGLRLFEVNK